MLEPLVFNSDLEEKIAMLESEALKTSSQRQGKGFLSSLQEETGGDLGDTLDDLLRQVEGREEQVQACGLGGFARAPPYRATTQVTNGRGPPIWPFTTRTGCQMGYSMLEGCRDSLRLLPVIHIS